MKSTIELEINGPLDEVAGLYADPTLSTQWMEDLAQYQPLSGTQGMPGSTYRLVPKDGGMTFTVTVTNRELPEEVRLKMETPGIDVRVKGMFAPLSPTTTRLTSEEVFTFNGSEAAPDAATEKAIKNAHRQHMEAFKRFAEKKTNH